MLEYLVMLWPRGEWCTLKIGLGTLVPVNLGLEKGTGSPGGKEERRWRLKEGSANRDFCKLNSGPGTAPE